MATLYSRARSIRGRLAITMLGVTALTVGQLFGAPSNMDAATFIVPCSTSQLIADIEAANDESLNPGGDTIELNASCTYLMFLKYNGTEFALPPITSDVIIAGHGARMEMMAGADARSVFSVASGGSLLLANVTLAQAARTLVNHGSMTLSNVTITHAVPRNSGPAILNDLTGVLAVISSTIEGQACFGCSSSGLENRGNATITDSTISDNSAGAAIHNQGTLAVFGTSFADDLTAIDNAASVEVHGSSFVHNQADHFRGGAIYNGSAADLIVDGSYFEDNSGDIEGGAIYNGTDAIAQVVNTTFYNNHVGSHFFPCCVGGDGGAISNHASLRLQHVSFARNGAGSGADVASPEGLASVEASAFDSLRAGVHCSGNIADFGDNVIDFGAGCPSTFTVGDPQLTSPAVHGSGTKTLAFGANSAAFDAVPTAGCPSYDQRGVSRPVGAACDAGAFEDQRPFVPGTPGVISGTNPNQGTFTLGWTAATDPDGTFPSYRLYRRDADDAHFTEVDSPISASAFRTGEAEGTFTYAVAADDGNLLSAKSAASASIVVDRTAPSAPSRRADRSPEGGNWWRDTVTVTFFGSTDPALPDGSPGSGVASITAPITKSTSGVFTLSGTATDAAGNVSDETTATVRVDAESPDVGFTACPGDVILRSATSLLWTASDASSGISGATSGSVALDTSTLGTRTATVTATDVVGHQATASCSYRVIYDFQGFFSPLSNPPKLTDLKAGDVLPVVFGLGGDQGFAVIAAGFPQSAPTSCASPGVLTSGDATVASRPLDFSKVLGGRYRYSWATSKSWSGTCRQLIISLIDGTVHRANVRFK
jgi:hypothetical protein